MGETDESGLMEGMWAAFVGWALRQDEMRAGFEADTGQRWIAPAGGGINAAIDKACGLDSEREAYVENFVHWVTVNHWELYT